MNFWGNLPIPDAYVIGLLLGGVLHALAAKPLCRHGRAPRAAGLALLLPGLGLIAWAMAAARKIRIDRPAVLLTRGPYAIGRNPMFLGWALSCLGLSLLANSCWLLAATSAAGLYVHGNDVRKEEETLLARFGEEYRAYRRRTPRYL
jgi:protein-S-isoprenylcysteine O-methyltransferase Ste14